MSDKLLSKEDIAKLREDFEAEIKDVGEQSALNALKAKYLGPKGFISSMLKSLKGLPPELRREYGRAINELKESIRTKIEEYSKFLAERARREKEKKERVDLTLRGVPIDVGGLHPLTLVIRELKEVFKSLGFEVVQGPELEDEYYNFDALNIPKDHPARDMWDSFWISEGKLLRTHTSPVQIRVMESRKPPFQVVSVGKCYRRDNLDATHSFQFHQIEGFMVDRNVNFSHLRGVLLEFARRVFGRSRRVKLVPSYFPFTEPSAEVSIDCFRCGGKDPNCPVCKGEGWIEILGAGMINPQVLERVGISPEEWTGFAFGMGIERIAMLKYGIDDIRLFYDNRLSFLQQWASI